MWKKEIKIQSENLRSNCSAMYKGEAINTDLQYV